MELAVSPRAEGRGVDEDTTTEDGRRVPRSFDAAFPELYRHAYRVAFRLCGSDPDAKDLAQDALVRAYGRWQQVAAYADPNAWIARVVTNLAFDQWRRRRLFRRLPVEARRDAVDDDHVDLYLALHALPRRQRQVVVLRYLADQTEAATAEAMGCSIGTVKQHASRGLRSLRARLDLPSISEEPS